MLLKLNIKPKHKICHHLYKIKKKKTIIVLFGRIRYYFIYTSRNEIFPKFATFLSDMDKCQHM